MRSAPAKPLGCWARSAAALEPRSWAAVGLAAAAAAAAPNAAPNHDPRVMAWGVLCGVCVCGGWLWATLCIVLCLVFLLFRL